MMMLCNCQPCVGLACYYRHLPKNARSHWSNFDGLMDLAVVRPTSTEIQTQKNFILVISSFLLIQFERSRVIFEAEKKRKKMMSKHDGFGTYFRISGF